MGEGKREENKTKMWRPKEKGQKKISPNKKKNKKKTETSLFFLTCYFVSWNSSSQKEGRQLIKDKPTYHFKVKEYRLIYLAFALQHNTNILRIKLNLLSFMIIYIKQRLAFLDF